MYYVLVNTEESDCSLWCVVWVRCEACQGKVWKL